MIARPDGMGAFEFVAIAALRAKQLTRGCLPKLEGNHGTAVMARREVSEGKIMSTPRLADDPAVDAVDS
jgi:DNA-directed RNA polymerase subunit K/omega